MDRQKTHIMFVHLIGSYLIRVVWNEALSR
jgi:hypothetical protein